MIRRQIETEFGFLDFLKLVFYFFHDKLDQIEEKIYWQRKLQFKFTSMISDHSTQFSYHFIKSISKSHNFMALNFRF